MTAQAEQSYETLSDVALAARVAGNDARAIRLVTQRNNQRLFRAAWSILRNRAEAEDAVQETYMRGFAAIAGFNGLSSLSTWLTRIAINEALMRKRAAKRRAAALNSNSVTVIDEYREKLMGSSEHRSTPESAVMRAQLAKLLEGAVAQLPETYRLVFMLREIEGLSVEETAETLEILPQTVKTRFLRARRQLQQLLDPELKNALGDAFPFAGADCESLTRRVLERLGHSGGTIGGEAT
jgi:RNA polymerase sigma-70 factor (ECF subfamily)